MAPNQYTQQLTYTNVASWILTTLFLGLATGNVWWGLTFFTGIVLVGGIVESLIMIAHQRHETHPGARQ